MNQTLKIKGTNVFQRNYNCKSPIVLNVGGARSSKSYSILQRLALAFITENNKKILISRKTLPALRITAYKDFVNVLSELGFYKLCKHNKTERIISYKNNYVAFLSVDNPDKIKSTEWNYIFLEEANEFSWEDFLILKTRTSAKKSEGEYNQIFLALNPDNEQSWVHQKLEHAQNVEILHSTYKNNPFLDQSYIDELESLKELDEEKYKALVLGQWATPKEVIYTNWQEIDTFPTDCEEVVFGMDFGFNNPTTLVKCGIKDSEIYLDEILYERKLTTPEIIQRLHPFEYDLSVIYGDSAVPGTIEEIKRAGYNIKASDKNVKGGIDFLKGKKIYITSSSVNLLKEIKSYTWKKNKNGDVSDSEPVKYNDHALDACRYACWTHWGLNYSPRIKQSDVEFEVEFDIHNLRY